MKNDCKRYRAGEKAGVGKTHLFDPLPLSRRDEEKGLQCTVFPRPIEGILRDGAAAFESKNRPGHKWREDQKRPGEKPIQRDPVVAAANRTTA